MKKKLLITLALLIGALSPISAQKMEKYQLPNQQWLVISEGALENASIGSYSIAIFNDENLIEFVQGAIFSRNGSLFTDRGTARIEFLDINNDQKPEIIVTKLTAGSGKYLEIDLITNNNDQLKRLAKISGTNSQEIKAELLRIYQDKKF